MKNLFRFLGVLLLITGLFVQSAGAAVTVGVTNPSNTTPNLAASYPSLAAAITALDAITAISGPVILTCGASGTETAPVGGFAINFTAVTTAVNNVVISGSGSTITAYSPQASGSRVDAIFKIIGSDNVTIQNFIMQENSLNTTTTVGTNTMTEFGVAVFYANTTNGAQNNIIQNNTISLSGTYQNSIGIYSTTQHSSTSYSSSVPATNNTGLNSGLKIYGNTIYAVSYGIEYVSTPNTATITDSGVEIGGSAAGTGNTITYGNNTVADAAWVSISTASAGINYRNGVNVSIKNNNVTSNTMTITTTAITLSAGTNPIGATYTNTISNNTVNVTSTGTGVNTNGISFGYGISTGTIVGNSNSINLTQSITAASSGQVNGILAGYTFLSSTLNSNTVNITQSTSSGANSGQVTGIGNNPGATVSGSTQTINGNIITFKQNTTGGTYTGVMIYIFAQYASSGFSVGTGTINTNQLLTTGSTIRSTGTIYGILHDYTYTTSLTIDGNTINIDRVAATGNIYGTYETTSGSTFANTITNNSITFTNLATSGVSYGIQTLGGTASTTKNINVNTISISGSCTGQSIGIIAGYGNGNMNSNNITINNSSTNSNGIWPNQTGAGAFTVSLNTISLTSNSTSPTQMTGISGGATGPFQIFSNTFTAMNLTGVITGAPVISAITCGAGNGSNIYNNVVTNISAGAAGSTASPVIDGILISGGTATNVYKNKIYGITTNSTGSSTVVNGIRISAGTTNTVYNNLIGNLTASSASSTDALRGISITSTTTSSTNNIYYNNVYLSGSGGANFGSSGIYHAASSTATTAVLNLRNNIIVNNCTPSGTGMVVAYRRSSGLATNLANYAATSNNNLFYAAATGAFIYFDGTSSALTMTAYKSGVFTAGTIAPRDAASVTENPNWLSTTGSDATFLHINPAVATQIESGGASISTFTTDYDGDTRNGSTPDIGADEFNGTAADFSPPTISFTALTNGCGTSDRTLAGVTIADASGVPVTGTLVPRVYYKKNSGSWFSQPGILTAGSGTSGTWSFTIVATDMGGLAVNDVISYYVIAQDLSTSNNIASNPSAGLTAVDVNTITTPPTVPNTTTILLTLSGTYTIGSGGNYPTLTAALNAYTTACLSGSVIFSLTDAAYSGETLPITINANNSASAVNNLTIKPASGVSPVISGVSATGIIVLNGADFVTIDGSNGSTVNTVCPASAASRDMTIMNTGTSTTSAVIWLQTTAGLDAATNNTIKNIKLTGSGVTQTLFGVGSGSSTISTASLGTSNNNNAIINNNISGVQYGIYSQGANSGTKNSGTVINQNTFNTSANAKGGIWVGFENNIIISGNTISNIAQTSSPDVFGITLGMGTSVSATSSSGNEVTNATVSNNIIGSVVNSGTFSAVGIAIASATSGTTTLSNNMISSVAGNGTTGDFSAGIILGGGAGSTTNLYHNTVSMQGTITGSTAATQTSACLAVTNSTAPTINLKNNIFSNTQIGNTSATLRFACIALAYSTYTTLVSDNNDLYCAGAGPGTYQVGITGTVVAGTNSTTLANWQTTSGKDAASKNAAPVFLGAPYSLSLDIGNVSNGNNLNGTGAAGTGIALDIDCETRNGTTPDIGADEFSPSNCSAAVGGTASGSNAFCVSGTPTITAAGYSLGIGSTYQWMSSASAGDYPSAGAPVSGQINPASLTTGIVSTTTYYWLKVSCATNSSTDYSTMVTITVNPLPAAPGNPTSNSPQCGNVTLTQNGTPPSGETWYWQTSASGTTVNPGVNDQATYQVSSSGTYYIRSRNNTSLCWSSGAGSLAIVSVSAIPAAAITPVPANAATGICYAGTSPVTSVSWAAVTGATSYDVYFGAGALPGTVTSNVLTNSYTTGALAAGLTYYWKVVPKNVCGDATGATTWTFSTSAAPCYCTPTYTNLCSSSDYINSFSVNTLSNLSTGCSGNTNNYILYPATGTNTTTLTAGVSYTASVTIGSGGSGNVGIWIDYNDNGQFEASERYINSALIASSGTATIAVAVPGNAPIGSHRMRVREVYSTTLATVDPCSNGGYGETEDYTVTIFSAPIPVISSLGSTFGCVGSSLIINGTDLSGATIVTIGGTNAVITGTTATTVNATVGSGTTGTVSVTTSGGTSTSSEIFTMNQLPASVSVTGGGTFCGGTATLYASNGGDGIIYFQGNTSGGTSTAVASLSAVVSTSGTWYFRAQSAAGCWGPEGSANVTINEPPVTTGASVCQGGSGSLSSTSCAQAYVNSGTSITGTWKAATDPVAIRPKTSIINTATCSFDASITRNYVATLFQVTVTGAYVFEMNDNSSYDGMGYIVSGAFSPGSCVTGTWIRGDDDGGSGLSEPKLGASGTGDGIMTLTAGVTYTLISTTYSSSSGTYSGSFTWTITPPAGGQILLPGPANSIQWFTSATGGTAIGSGSPFNPVGVANSGLANTNTPGTTVYYAECSLSPGCRTATNFVINALPAPSISGNSPFCPGSSTTLDAGLFSGYTWSTGASVQSIAAMTEGTFTVTVSDVNGCTASSSATTTVYTAPTATITPNGMVGYCISGPLTAGGGQDYLWSTNETTHDITVTSSGNYSVTVTDGHGCTSVASQFVTINSQPVAPSITKSPDVTEVCIYTNVSATFGIGSGGVGCTDNYEYRYNGIGSWTDYTPGSPLTDISAGSLEIRTTRGGCQAGCTPDVSTVTWTFVPQPVPGEIIKNPNIAHVCEGTLVKASFGSPTGGIGCTETRNYRYENSPDWIPYVADDPIPTTGHTAVYLKSEVTNCQTGCISMALYANWVIDPLPAPAITGSALTCATSTGNIYSTPLVTGDTYKWEISGGVIDGPVNGHSISVTWGPGASGWVSVSDTSSAGCSVTTGHYNVALETVTAITGQPAGGSVCAGTNHLFTVSADGTAPISYQWYEETAGLLSGEISSDFSTGTAGTYYVIVAGACGPLESDHVSLTVIPISDKTVAALASPVCQGTGTSISVAMSDPSTSYQLRNNAGNALIGSALSGNGGTIYLPTGNLSATTTFNVMATLGFCTLQMSNTPTVAVNPMSTPPLTGPVTVCAGSAGNIYTTTFLPGQFYLWSVTGAASFTGQGTATLTVTWGNGSTGTVTITAYNQSTFCTAANSLTVAINPRPAPTVSGPTTVYPGLSGTYSTTVVAGYSYTWNVTGAASFSGQGTSSINVIWGAVGTGSVSVSALNTLTGCTGISSPLNVAILPVYKISGYFNYNNTEKNPLDNISLNLKSGAATIQSTTTASDGYYQFLNLWPGTYHIEATTVKPSGNVNTTDASAVNTWWVSNQPIERVNWYAGDVNNTDMINATDASAIQRQFVYGIPFSRGEWTFAVQPNSSAANPPTSTDNIIALAGADVAVNYYGLCVGDFNCSYLPPSGKSVFSGKPNLKLEYSGTQQAGPNTEFMLPVYVTSGMQVGAISLIMNFPEELVSVEEVMLSNGDNSLPSAQQLSYNVIGNELRIGWTSMQPMELPSEGQLITIRMKTTGAFVTGESIRLALKEDNLNELADGLASPLSNALLTTNVVEASSTGIPDPAAGIVTFGNHPNPFADFTMITYSLPSDGKVVLEIHNMLGATVMNLVNSDQKKGDHTVRVECLHLNPGVYTASLKFTSGSSVDYKTIKLIRDR